MAQSYFLPTSLVQWVPHYHKQQQTPSSFLSLLFHRHHHHLLASSLGARKRNGIISLNKSTALYTFSITSQSRDAILMDLYVLTPELEGPEAGLAESVALPAGLDDF